MNFASTLTTEYKMAACDPQTSGGLLMGVDADKADDILKELHESGFAQAQVIGEVLHSRNKFVYLI